MNRPACYFCHRGVHTSKETGDRIVNGLPVCRNCLVLWRMWSQGIESMNLYKRRPRDGYTQHGIEAALMNRYSHEKRSCKRCGATEVRKIRYITEKQDFKFDEFKEFIYSGARMFERMTGKIPKCVALTAYEHDQVTELCSSLEYKKDKSGHELVMFLGYQVFKVTNIFFRFPELEAYISRSVE